MRITIDIDDDLLDRAKEQARRGRQSLRAFIEEILRRALEQGSARRRRFRLPDASVPGDLRPGVDWHGLLHHAYGDQNA